MSKNIFAVIVVTVVGFYLIVRELRGDFVSLRAAAFGEFHDYLRDGKVEPALFQGPFLDLSSEKYFIFNWYHVPKESSDTVRVTVYVPPYFYGFRAEVGGSGIEKVVNTKATGK